MFQVVRYTGCCSKLDIFRYLSEVFLGPRGPRRTTRNYLTISKIVRVLTFNEVKGGKTQNWRDQKQDISFSGKHIHDLMSSSSSHLCTNVRFFLEVERSSELNMAFFDMCNSKEFAFATEPAQK